MNNIINILINNILFSKIFNDGVYNSNNLFFNLPLEYSQGKIVNFNQRFIAD